MHRRSVVIFGLVSLAIGALLVTGYISLTGPHGKVVARMEKKDPGGFLHTVTVRQFGGRFNSELGEEGSGGRVLHVSSHEVYEGSYPITNTTISWPELHKFRVSFSNGTAVDCVWNTTNYVWTVY